MVRMRVVEAQELHALLSGQALEPEVVLRRNLVAPGALGIADVVDPLDVGDARGIAPPPEQASAALLRVGVAPVRPDLVEKISRNRDHAAVQNFPER